MLPVPGIETAAETVAFRVPQARCKLPVPGIEAAGKNVMFRFSQVCCKIAAYDHHIKGVNKMKKPLIQKLGLLGLVSFLSYTAAVVFSPLAYPGYDWMAQAVSDLSAADAPSLGLWNSLSSLYNVCEVLCATMVCVGIQGKKTKLLRAGICIFAVMEWVSAVGYRAFPLSSSGYAGAFQDRMHLVVTALVVILSIASLVTIIVAGARDKENRSYGVCAAVALTMMLVGAVGMNAVPAEYFGIVERFSVFAATGFNAALGIHLYLAK